MSSEQLISFPEEFPLRFHHSTVVILSSPRIQSLHVDFPTFSDLFIDQNQRNRGVNSYTAGQRWYGWTSFHFPFPYIWTLFSCPPELFGSPEFQFT